MKRAGQAEGGLIGADCCTYRRCRAVHAGMQTFLLFSSCLSPDPAVGRACREDTGESLVLEQAGHRCRGVFSARRCLGRGTWTPIACEKHSMKDLKHGRAAAGLVHSTRRIIARLYLPSSTDCILSVDIWRINKAPLHDGC